MVAAEMVAVGRRTGVLRLNLRLGLRLRLGLGLRPRLRLRLGLGLRTRLRGGLDPISPIGSIAAIAVLGHGRAARTGEQDKGKGGWEFGFHCLDPRAPAARSCVSRTPTIARPAEPRLNGVTPTTVLTRSADVTAHPNDVVGFWLGAGPAKWFKKVIAFDEAIRLKFESTHHKAARSEYDAWAQTPDGALALLILLDQFPRNLYRSSAHAFATDTKARSIARAAIESGFDRQVNPALRNFFYLPFEHSEDLADQDYGLALCAEAGVEDDLKWAGIHRDIIARFGRFPHRNAALGRVTTSEEQEFLDEGGFGG
jgi:uncharacterized protein (DUF924 family)